MQEIKTVSTENEISLSVSSTTGNTSVSSSNLCFRAGCAYESPEERGYAHLLEHMLLKGTSRRPSSTAIGEEIDSVGAFQNASTGPEELTFVFQTPSDSLPLLLDVLSDEVRHSIIDPETLANEKTVISEEIEKSKNNHMRTFLIESVAHLLSNHPASRDPLGEWACIEQATPEALRAYHQKHIVPARASELMITDLDPGEASSAFEKVFGDWDAPGIPAHMPQAEVNPTNAHLTTASTVPLWGVWYASPLPTDIQEYVALRMIENLLTYGYSSLLRDALRTQRGLVYGISSWSRARAGLLVHGFYNSSRQPAAVLDVAREIISSAPEKLTSATTEKLQRQLRGLLLRLFADDQQNILGFFRKLESMRITDFSPASIIDVIEHTTPETLRAAHARFFSEDVCSHSSTEA